MTTRVANFKSLKGSIALQLAKIAARVTVR